MAAAKYDASSIRSIREDRERIRTRPIMRVQNRTREILDYSTGVIELVDPRTGHVHPSSYDPTALIGTRRDRLVIIGHHHDEVVKGKNGKRVVIHYVLCRCDCGNKVVVRYNDFKSKGRHVHSCGCYRDEMREKAHVTHGKWKHPLYANIYMKMIERCYRPWSKLYKDYGGRGIYICDEWYTPGVRGNPGFVNFYNWSMENGYRMERGPGGRNLITIDRIDNDGPYAPWNCRWVSYTVQENNRRITRYIEDLDGTISFGDFARKYGIKIDYVDVRKRIGWSDAAIVYAVTHPELGITNKFRNSPYSTADGYSVPIPSLEVQRKMRERRLKRGE